MLSEGNVMSSNCKQCQASFEVTEQEIEFRQKMAPTFDGQSFEIPDPTLCPRCRNRRRLAARNVVNLYKRKCDLCQKEVVSMYSPDKTDIKVYCYDCWWSDKWSHTDYAEDYDPNRSFFEQLEELKRKVPAPALMHSGDENSDYINLSNDNKNSYLVFLSGRNEDTYYGYWTEDSKSCVDVNYVGFSELCYESTNLGKCYNVNWAINCGSCRDSYFIEDCANCNDCILCSRLSHKQYCYKNKQLSKEEYEKVKAEFLEKIEEKLEEYKEEFNQIILSTPKKYSQTLRSENCTGDNIFDSKNCINCYRCEQAEDCCNAWEINRGKDIQDMTGFGLDSELIYESQNIGLNSYRCAFVSFAYQLSDSYVCEHCYYSKNLFGCVGAKNHAEYCILNKQYTKEEYEKLVSQIISDMQKRDEWGEFFPSSFSSFGYNESIANFHYPLSKEEAAQLGYGWQENNYDVKFNGSPYEPLPIKEHEKDEQKRQELLNGVLKCEQTGRPFKIMPQELLFHIRQRLPLPRRHYLVRILDRLHLLNPTDLFSRQCDCEQTGHKHQGRCQIRFETTYAPDRPGKVYCEDCYWREEK
jgi:hypothetical protein